MEGPTHRISQEDLAACADVILAQTEEDAFRIASALETIEPGIAHELITSDFFNAYQAYVWFFRTEPGDLVRERMMLEPASALEDGVLIEEGDLFEVLFVIRDKKACLVITDGSEVVAEYDGRGAPEQAWTYLRENEGL